MLKTRLTELLGIKHPIILAGMNWITTPKLVAAVSNAGGLGIFAAAHCTAEELRKYIREIKELTDKPFGINQVLAFPHAKEKIAAAIEEKVPVINYALGKPWFVEKVHAYGGKVMATVALSKHAVKAEQLGCDFMSVTGHEAAAHGANATSLVLIPIVANQVKIPFIAAGGFYDGRGLAAALVLGASGVSLGTRFMLTQECHLHEKFKQLCLKASEEDTVYSNAFDGMFGRALRSKVTDELTKEVFPLVKSMKGALMVKRMMNLSLGQFILASRKMTKEEGGPSMMQQAQMAAGMTRVQKAIYDGNVDEGVLFAGQCLGGIQDVPTCKEVIERIVAQAEETLEKTGKMRSPN